MTSITDSKISKFNVFIIFNNNKDKSDLNSEISPKDVHSQTHRILLGMLVIGIHRESRFNSRRGRQQNVPAKLAMQRYTGPLWLC